MAVEKVETLIIGGGQAGLAVSRHLGKLGKEHLASRAQAHRRALALRALGLARGQWPRLA